VANLVVRQDRAMATGNDRPGVQTRRGASQQDSLARENLPFVEIGPPPNAIVVCLIDVAPLIQHHRQDAHPPERHHLAAKVSAAIKNMDPDNGKDLAAVCTGGRARICFEAIITEGPLFNAFASRKFLMVGDVRCPIWAPRRELPHVVQLMGIRPYMQDADLRRALLATGATLLSVADFSIERTMLDDDTQADTAIARVKLGNPDNFIPRRRSFRQVRVGDNIVSIRFVRDGLTTRKRRGSRRRTQRTRGKNKSNAPPAPAAATTVAATARPAAPVNSAPATAQAAPPAPLAPAPAPPTVPTYAAMAARPPSPGQHATARPSRSVTPAPQATVARARSVSLSETGSSPQARSTPKSVAPARSSKKAGARTISERSPEVALSGAASSPTASPSTSSPASCLSGSTMHQRIDKYFENSRFVTSPVDPDMFIDMDMDDDPDGDLAFYGY